ncbi:hypothetical protein COLO4_26199 [Corchorus olitorius]|uniref:CCHC-type domain-containing protein n=1 Tax=Corchorus olitorius TaxID=93759 RepID=A0A1R3HYC5_9ROSI|nr:hypothetical protein COLO4_26199 [Corchorus olitorius]
MSMVLMAILAMMVVMIENIEPSPLSPLSSPPRSLLFQWIDNRNKKQLKGGDHEEMELSYGASLQQDDNEKAFQEDYGVWDPTPESGGACASPVPHAEYSRRLISEFDHQPTADPNPQTEASTVTPLQSPSPSGKGFLLGLFLNRVRFIFPSTGKCSFVVGGHIASECTTQAQCWNCREPGHVASHCPNESICRSCGKPGHLARDCPDPEKQSGDTRLCNNCYRPGHIAADCTNDKACKNCRKTGHIARECDNDPVCNLCNASGHLARQCSKGRILTERGGAGGRWNGGYHDVVCRSCNQVGHMSRECRGAPIICRNCGGRGHMAYECPSGRVANRGYRRY